MSSVPSAGDHAGAGVVSGHRYSFFTKFGLGYIIAITLCFFVLLSTILLASYVCCHQRHRRNDRRRRPSSPHSDATAVTLHRTIFISEEDDGAADEAAGMGIDQVVINSYPKFPFCKGTNTLEVTESLCSICLCEYREGEMVRMMPDCKHFFHLLCIDAWLKLNGSCPVCRSSPLPTPMSTPLSEVVPLSQFPSDRRR